MLHSDPKSTTTLREGSRELATLYAQAESWPCGGLSAQIVPSASDQRSSTDASTEEGTRCIESNAVFVDADGRWAVAPPSVLVAFQLLE